MTKRPLLLIFSSVIILTFLYSQFVYAFGIMPFLPPKIEDITIHINKYGQITNADITRNVVTAINDITKEGEKSAWRELTLLKKIEKE